MRKGTKISRSKATLEHIEWLANQRSRVQDLSLAHYRLLTASKDRSKKRLQLRFLGLVFSLCRAVFLVERTSSNQRLDEAAHKHSKDFLQLLVRDNIINYPQDKGTRRWSGGYYLNNAFFRIRDLWSDLNPPDPSSVETDGKANHRIVMHILDNGDASGYDRRDLFDAALFLAETIFQKLSKWTTQSDEIAE